MFNLKSFALFVSGVGFCRCYGGGGGGETSSSTETNTTTQNIDSRIANDGGLVATGMSRINSSITTVDPEIAKAAFQFAGDANAINGEGFEKLLSVAERITTKNSDNATTLASRFQDNVMQAYSQAKADVSGGIDQKTMIVLGVVGAAALVLRRGK